MLRQVADVALVAHHGVPRRFIPGLGEKCLNGAADDFFCLNVFQYDRKMVEPLIVSLERHARLVGRPGLTSTPASITLTILAGSWGRDGASCTVLGVVPLLSCAKTTFLAMYAGINA